MKVFPGSFPWREFEALDVERLATACRLANEAVAAEAEAIKKAAAR